MTGVCEVYDPATDSWENLSAMPSQRVGVVAAVVDNKIYLVDGGSGKTEVYDPATDLWTEKASIPSAPYNDNGWRGTCVVIDNKIHVIGAFPVSNSHQIYDPLTDGWTAETPLVSSYWFAMAGATTGVNAPKRIYALGGSNTPTWIGLIDDLPVSSCQSFDFATGNWTAIPSLPSGRFQVAVGVVDDVVYAIWGWLPSVNNARVASVGNEKYVPIGYATVSSDKSSSVTLGMAAVLIASAVAVLIGLIMYFRKNRK